MSYRKALVSFAFILAFGCASGKLPSPVGVTLKNGQNAVEAGPVPGSPFATLAEAMAGIRAHRASTRQKAIYLAVRRVNGYAVESYITHRSVRLGDMVADGLPIGGDPLHPETIVVAGGGAIGSLQRAASGEYAIVDARDLSAVVTGPPPADDLPSVVPVQLTNHGRNVQWKPRYAFAPDANHIQVASILKWLRANASEVSIRAGGSRHSWSAVAATEGAFIYPNRMKGFGPAADDKTLWTPVSDSLVRVAAGVTIREANAALWNMNKAFAVLGGYDGQTMGGVFPTGTHGSVLSHGPLASMIRSIDLVSGDERLLRIEPANGITDPGKFAAKAPGRKLIQDDDTFRAALVHIGSIGVVTSLVIEVADAFQMREVRTLEKLPHAIEILRGGQIYRHFQKVQVPLWVSPDDGRRFAGHPSPAYHLELLVNLHSDLVVVTSRHPTSDIGGDDAADHRRPRFATWLQDRFPTVLAAVSEWIATNIPRMTPSLVNSAMRALKDDAYIDRSYRVFNIGDGANRIPALSATIFVPLRDDRYLEAIQELRSVAADFAREHHRYQSGPVALRFVKASPAHLAPREDVCAIELIFAGRSPWAKEMVAVYYRSLRRRFGSQVWIHWGQLVNGIDAADISETYPQYPAWRQVRDELDPDGRFLNEWLRAFLPAR